MDKILAIIIIFLGISILMAAVLAMGAVPKIFQNAEVINETQDETKNQTDIIIKQFMRENNTTQKILKNQNISLQNQQHLIEHMNKTIEQNHVDIVMNANLSRTIQDIADEILKISKEHKQVAQDHNRIQNITSHTTDNINRMLEQHGENSVKKFDEIKAAQDYLNKTLQEIKQQINK